jgi:hypothetical protein
MSEEMKIWSHRHYQATQLLAADVPVKNAVRWLVRQKNVHSFACVCEGVFEEEVGFQCADADTVGCEYPVAQPGHSRRDQRMAQFGLQLERKVMVPRNEKPVSGRQSRIPNEKICKLFFIAPIAGISAVDEDIRSGNVKVPVPAVGVGDHHKLLVVENSPEHLSGGLFEAYTCAFFA